jgi:ABC-type nitrate/sulfonate/bicarbonate transport system ATPase subunit
MVHLLNSGNTYIHQLFSEMKQRVAIVRALAFTPKILLINKRFAAFGICTIQKIFQQQSLRIHQTIRKTVPFVKDNLIQEAVALGDRVIIIIVLSPKYAGINEEFTIKLRHLRQLNKPTIVHAIAEQNLHQSREFEINEIQDIEIGENKIAARSAL